MTPDLSIIVPVFNRASVLDYSLESVRRAAGNYRLEIIVVDDGSTPPLAESLPILHAVGAKVIHQKNQGLLFARLNGFAHATGRYTLFLDSDDLVGPEKFRAQLGAMDAAGLDASTTDIAQTALEGPFDSLVITQDAPLSAPADAADFYLRLQPPPHGPIFRTDYLRRFVDHAFFPPSAAYNSVAEIWFYYNACATPARVQLVPGPHTIVGRHAGVRLTNYWEKLGVASLGVMEAFARSCVATADTERARTLAGEIAFRSWRRLPRGFSPEFAARQLGIWQRLPKGELRALGGGSFQLLSRVLGPTRAGELFKRWQNGTYESCRTLPDAEVAALLGKLPAP